MCCGNTELIRVSLIDQLSRIRINPVVTTPDTAVNNHFNAAKVLLLNFSTGLNNISSSSCVN